MASDVQIADQVARQAIERGAMQKHRELSDLIRYLLVKKPPRTIVEIGTAKGGTWYVWSVLAARGAKLISIDLPGGHFGGGYTTADAQTYAGWLGLDQRPHFLRRDSHKESTRVALEKLLDGETIDLLFIDGDHTIEGVTRDWEMYSPLVKGTVVFHDIVEHPQWGNPSSQVDQLWEKIRREPYREFLDPTDTEFFDGRWGGIGVLEEVGL